MDKRDGRVPGVFTRRDVCVFSPDEMQSGDRAGMSERQQSLADDDMRNLSTRFVSVDGSDNAGRGVGIIPKPGCPIASGMQRVLFGPSLVPAAGARIMIPESVDDQVPYWLILRNQHLLGEADPHGVEHQPATAKVGQVQVGCRFD